MGVPAFFSWLASRYPQTIASVAEEKCRVVNGQRIPIDATQANPTGIEFDNLYLDMNGIIHPCCHPEDREPPATEEAMMEAIFEYIDHVFTLVRPRRLLYLAIDGVAPRAKMNQQRARRFRSAQEAEDRKRVIEKRVEALEADGVAPKYYYQVTKKKMSFDSNCITPGTPFMARLAQRLREYIDDRLHSNAAWKDVQVILSDASVPGEGEHKIMDFIRQQQSLPSYDPNMRHVLYGADADLIMLGLATHEPHFYIIREEFVPPPKKPCPICGFRGHALNECTGGDPVLKKNQHRKGSQVKATFIDESHSKEAGSHGEKEQGQEAQGDAERKTGEPQQKEMDADNDVDGNGDGDGAQVAKKAKAAAHTTAHTTLTTTTTTETKSDTLLEVEEDDRGEAEEHMATTTTTTTTNTATAVEQEAGEEEEKEEHDEENGDEEEEEQGDDDEGDEDEHNTDSDSNGDEDAFKPPHADHPAAHLFGYKRLQRRYPVFLLVDIPALRRCLQAEFTGGGNDARRQSGRERFKMNERGARMVDDWVLLCCLVGNDFLPHLPSLSIHEGAIDTLTRLYATMQRSLGGFLHDNGHVNLPRLGMFLARLGTMEDHVIRQRFVESKQKSIVRKQHKLLTKFRMQDLTGRQMFDLTQTSLLNLYSTAMVANNVAVATSSTTKTRTTTASTGGGAGVEQKMAVSDAAAGEEQVQQQEQRQQQDQQQQQPQQQHQQAQQQQQAQQKGKETETTTSASAGRDPSSMTAEERRQWLKQKRKEKKKRRKAAKSNKQQQSQQQRQGGTADESANGTPPSKKAKQSSSLPVSSSASSSSPAPPPTTTTTTTRRMRLPFGALALMLAMGYIAVDLNFDALANTEPAKSMTYYHVQHHTPPPASLIIPAAILVALLDTLYSLLVVRDARELLFLVLGSYVLYLFIGIVKPSMETMSGASLDDVDEYIPQLEAIRDAHLYMCPTVAAMLLCTVYTHMISPPSSSSSSSASSKHKKKHK